MKRILLAGATGYLGSFIVKELIKRNYFLRTVVRNPGKLNQKEITPNETIIAKSFDPEHIKGSCKDIDVVISTVGITRQKDGLTYLDVDYKANHNLLEEAKENGVKKFIFVSVLNGEDLRDLKICEAKEMFVDELKKSGLDYTVIRPNGFFSDMTEFYKMARKGRAYLFGDGSFKTNPIHGKDLAEVCVNSVGGNDTEINVGGPEILTHKEIAKIAFKIVNSPVKITYIPNWMRISVLKLMKLFTGIKTYGPVEFFMTVMSRDMIAPKYGSHTLKEYFLNLKIKTYN